VCLFPLNGLCKWFFKKLSGLLVTLFGTPAAVDAVGTISKHYSETVLLSFSPELRFYPRSFSHTFERRCCTHHMKQESRKGHCGCVAQATFLVHCWSWLEDFRSKCVVDSLRVKHVTAREFGGAQRLQSIAIGDSRNLLSISLWE
jgi:hypothetical protein